MCKEVLVAELNRICNNNLSSSANHKLCIVQVDLPRASDLDSYPALERACGKFTKVDMENKPAFPGDIKDHP